MKRLKRWIIVFVTQKLHKTLVFCTRSGMSAPMRNKVTVSKKSYRSYSYRVTWTQADNRKSKWFKLKSDAEMFRDETVEELSARGSSQTPVTPAELRAVHSFREALALLPDHAQGATLDDAVKSFTKGLESRHKSISCEVVSDKLLTKLMVEGKSKSHRDAVDYRLKRFNQGYGDWLACDVTTEVIDDFLTHLEVGQQTKLHYRRAIGQMFNHAIKIKAAPVNPVEDAIKPKAAPAPTGILKPDEVAALLTHADEEALPGLAISFFAGVRRAEIERLDWSEIDLDEGFIEIKAENAKTAQRRVIPMSDNLKAWLRPYAVPRGQVVQTPAIWRKSQERAREAAGIIKWPHNAGRHSFASYHLAMNDDPGKLAMALGHPDPRLLFRHYRQLVTAKVAKTYWGVFPADGTTITNIKTA
jgi:integrase